MSQAIAVCHGEFGRAALYSLNKAIITHAHREGHLIFHVDGSPAYVPTGGDVVKIVPGTAAAISPWEPHGFEVTDAGPNICLVLYIKPMWFLENSTSAEFALKFGRSDLKLTDEMSGLVNRLTALLLDDEDQTGFDQLLFGLTRASFDLSWRNDVASLRRHACDRFSDFRVRRSLRLIQEKMGQDMDMERMARSVGLSRPHFFKLFKQYMGVTPNVYMNTLRSERAIEELLQTEKSVTDIAFDLGFSSQASFTRFFSSNVGIAPSEYRRVAHVTSGAFPMM
ncbi:AraC family transcriptional regulator [uncultured Roseobacter sp.]|uniref:AraC family transcriptional regulator n=1 Tax=uncultured Roseobacter sp. TaxID=114847 RepID=UPI00260A0CBD|nr:AraC family transcriptional regulator [uncultured Roseobacter sp.]